jgi:myo-inositol 2-dehydrogenase / D-chiro-inositol 1-dehydrogenase
MFSFVQALRNKTSMPVGARDGRQALVLAEAALESHKKKKPVKVRNG